MPAFETKERQRANKAAERRQSQLQEKKSAKKLALNPPKKDNRLGWKKEQDVQSNKKKKVAMDKLAKQRRNSEMAAAFLSKKGISHVSDSIAGDNNKDVFNREMAKRKGKGNANKIKAAKEEQVRQEVIKRKIKKDFEKEKVDEIKQRQKTRRMTIAEASSFGDQDQAWALGITLDEFQQLKSANPEIANPVGTSKMDESVGLMPVPSAVACGLDHNKIAASKKAREKALKKKEKRRQKNTGFLKKICPCLFCCCGSGNKELSIQPS
jgi:hypothetical protein